MSKLQPNNATTRRRVRAPDFPVTRALAALVLTFALALCVFALTADAGAQSRRAPRPAATPTPEPTPTPEASRGESESVPRGATAKKDPAVVVSFLILENDNPMMSLDYMARDDIWKEFLERLGKSRAVSLAQGGKATRGEALKRAKLERESYVVLFEMQEERDMGGDAGVGRVDSRNLLLKTYVYAPQTGSLKFADTIYQRPYRDTATIGGVRVPLPGGTSRRVERYPSQRQLEQAAREAADRLMSHFNVIPPPDN
ncbi:MAG TPA: hypothetical protein VM914_00275 [Pyrinomonadaceae bacterium]|jgi:hypothetical protein|nr:hypothetical protein [Pyrinomonadaceae bacterium]